MNPVKAQGTLFNKAQETMRISNAQKSNKKSETGILMSLGMSSLFTIIYLVLALGLSLIGLGWSPIWAYSIGGLLGLAAIVPGEGGVWTWKTKLQSDLEINGTQITVCWVGGLVSAVSAAISTVSFFAYLLQGLMPGWYDPNTAAGINVINIAIGWAVFGIAVFVYYATSDTSERNQNRAKSLHVAQQAIDEMIAGIAQGTKDDIDKLVGAMGVNQIFMEDALDEVAGAMGLSQARKDQLQALAGEMLNNPQPVQETAVPPPPPVKSPSYKTRQPQPESNGEGAGGYNPAPFE